MPTRQTIVRKCTKISKSRLHDLLMIGWSRSIAKFGKGAFADELGISTTAVEKQLVGSMPGFDLIADVFGFDPEVLDEVCEELGVRVVPRDSVCCVDDLNLLLSRALVKLNEATHPDSPGGRAIVHTEYLDGEDVMRALHRKSGEWLSQCADIRKPRGVAA